MNRTFIPGSEWLYLKVYTGHKSADEILQNTISPVITQLIHDKIIDKFFFVRYSDPKFHIRIRFHVDSVLNYGRLFQCITNYLTPSMQNGLIWNVQCDTYKRELERYGQYYISEIEDIFHVDSNSILEIIKLCNENDGGDDDRWKLSLILIDDMLSSFDYSIYEKKKLIQAMSSNFKDEFKFTSAVFTKQLNDKYRHYRRDIEDAINGNTITISKYKSCTNLRKNNIKLMAGKFTISTEDRDQLLYSLIHMTMNRLFRSKNRIFELVIYFFLYRYYDSYIAKNNIYSSVKI